MKLFSKILAALPTTILMTGSAFAHPGHVETSAMHSHWPALFAVGATLALLIGRILYSVRLRRRQQTEG